MTEPATVDSVFGRDAKDGQPAVNGTITDKGFDALKATVVTYNLSGQKAQVMAKYVEFLNMAQIQALAVTKKEDPYVVAARAHRAHYAGSVFGLKAHPFLYMPLSVSGKPMGKDEEKNGVKTGRKVWSVRSWGIAKSQDPEVVFEGAAGYMIFGYPTESDAMRVIDKFQARKLFGVRATLSKKSPTGVMEGGATGVLNGNYSDPIDLVPIPTDNGGYWNDPYARVEAGIPLVSFAQVVRKPEQYQLYRFEASVTRGFSRSDAKSTFGILSLVDDSISGDTALLAELQGGVSGFLPREDIHLASTLAQGSLVGVVMSATMKPEKDPKTQNPTGKMVPQWSISAIKVLMDVGSSNGSMPNPGQVAVQLPSKPTDAGPTTRNL